MTPGARVSAAITVLDRVLAGAAAEQALTNWARGSRFAGSGDRQAVRDLVYDALRCQRSFAHLGGAASGRGLMIGHARAGGIDPATLFTGAGHAPTPLTDAELQLPPPPEGATALDCPDWLAGNLQTALGDNFVPVMEAMRHRAPLFLRVNLARTTRDAAVTTLAAQGIVACPHPMVPTALEVTAGARKVQSSQAFATGLVELQDLSSQAVVALLPLADGARVLDFCAGGGGKSLALAARGKTTVFAHDADPRRMVDLPARAIRAGATIEVLPPGSVTGVYDLVLADVPCSGSGSWRRAPQSKWSLTPDRLAELTTIQAGILEQTAALTAQDGTLAYVTCSLLRAENEDRIAVFLAANPEWQQLLARRFTPLTGGDGFFVGLLSRKPKG